MAEDIFSFVIPLYNESAGVQLFHASLLQIIKQAVPGAYEIIYCNDGSTDTTLAKLQELARHNRHIRIVSLTRNFGKEIAVAAGINEARGAAIMTLDADGQHPVELIPEFIERWKAGSKVVVGIRTGNQKEGMVKRVGSKLFYWSFNRFTGKKLMPGLSDFRLIDHSVQREFSRMTERNRITRGLIDWLGYPQQYIRFHANPRLSGEATYSFKKLFKLAVDSVVSLSISPLHSTAYIGAVVLPVSTLLALVMIADVVIGDPFGWRLTGGAFVMVLLLFLIGIVLVSQGIIGMYLAHIHAETQNRPLYVIDREASVGLDG
jgi:polyisoprenyl-phosphate glycosyltransferase